MVALAAIVLAVSGVTATSIAAARQASLYWFNPDGSFDRLATSPSVTCNSNVHACSKGYQNADPDPNNPGKYINPTNLQQTLLKP